MINHFFHDLCGEPIVFQIFGQIKTDGGQDVSDYSLYHAIQIEGSIIMLTFDFVKSAKVICLKDFGGP
jgi:hypothetical protein